MRLQHRDRVLDRRAWYSSCVEPTWQTIMRIGLVVAKHRVPDVPGGVLSTDGSAFVPLLVAIVASSRRGSKTLNRQPSLADR